MQLISSPLSFIFSDWTTLFTCLAIGWISYKLSKFYLRVWSLPRGPTPLPIIGNILSLRGKKCNNVITWAEMAKEYGPIYTFWIGNQPWVFMTDLEMSKETFKKPEFGGRIRFKFHDILFGKNDERCDIVSDQFNHRWESNRRVAHAAVRKYAVSDKLAPLVCDVVEEAVNNIIKKEGINQPFLPNSYILSIYSIILASSAFGRRYSMDDPELVQLLDLFKATQDPLFALLDFVPIMRLFYPGHLDKLNKMFLTMGKILEQKFADHLKDFDENQIRDFCDALILAKQEAIAEAKETAKYLTNENLALAIFDLFGAGSDTSQLTTRWIIYYMAQYPDYQRKMREEIGSVIGDRMPVQDDRNECHLINAFMHEVMRCRPVAPISVTHKAMVDAKIGDYLIPEGTVVVQHLYAIQHDPKNFYKPEKFIPSRFLDSSGRFVSQKPPAYIPFGFGRRVCLGERLAIADIFLVVVNLLQKTSGYEIALKNGPGSADLEMRPDREGIAAPKDIELLLKKV